MITASIQSEISSKRIGLRLHREFDPDGGRYWIWRDEDGFDVLLGISHTLADARRDAAFAWSLPNWDFRFEGAQP